MAGVQAVTDWYRLYLIHRYGGLWLDISIVVNEPKEIEDIYDNLGNKVFLYEQITNRFIANDTEHPGIETWFIMARPGNGFLLLWKDEFEKAINMGFNAYTETAYDHYEFSDSYVSLWNNMYHTIYKCGQVVMQRNKIGYDKINTKDCFLTMFKHQYDLGSILLRKSPLNIKLINSERKIIERKCLEKFVNMYFRDN